MDTFSIEAMVRGYHVYQGIWDADLGEQLPCQREPMNSKDPFAVAVVKSHVTVGHIPRKFSRRLIFVVPDQSAKNAKIMRLENLALYGMCMYYTVYMYIQGCLKKQSITLY